LVKIILKKKPVKVIVDVDIMDLANSIKKILFNRVFHHFIFWAVVFTGIVFINNSDEFQMITTPNLIIICIVLPLPVYIHFYLLENFFNRKKHYLYLVFILFLIPLFALFFRSLFTEEMKKYNGTFIFIINMTIFLVITTGLKFLKSNFNQKIQIQQQQTIKLLTELELVRSGINPGFMKKILNHLYFLSLKKSSQVSNLILQFSEMLRHTIEDSRKKEVELSDELRNVTEYLNLENQISRHQIRIKTRGILKKKIVPLLLVSQVEKNLTDVNQTTKEPVTGEIQLCADEKNIFFSMKINKSKNFKFFFMDINALKNRMQQHYSDKHIISHQEDGDSVTTIIQIFQDKLYPNNKPQNIR